MSPNLSALRVLIVHDWLTTWAGSERCVQELVRLFPTADVIVGVCSDAMRDENDVTRMAMETWLAKVPGARTHHRWFLPLQALAFATINTDGYDLVLSSSHAFSKMVRPRAGVPHICYCHSPPRYLWDLHQTYATHASLLQRAALSVGSPLLRYTDRRSAQGVDRFIANSHHVKRRIQRVYGKHATVVYPPVCRKPAECNVASRDNFLLTLGRLVPYKRVDLVVRAAERLGMRLVVAGDGPERAALEALAGPHTEFVGAVTEPEAARLLSSCGAFVFCAEEDFGITPVEANAHGAPVVAYSVGGVSESMIAGKTAEFFHRQTVDDLVAAIRRAHDHAWDDETLRQNAARFSPERFRLGIRTVVERTMNGSTAIPCA